MNPLIFKLIKIAVFLISGYITARITVNYFRKKNSNSSMSDPEIIALAVFSGALVSGLFSFTIKRIFF